MLEELAVGKVFHVERMLLVENHDLAAIEGKIPMLFLIFRDEKSVLYCVAVASFDTNEEDDFLYFFDSAGRHRLSVESFPLFNPSSG